MGNLFGKGKANVVVTTPTPKTTSKPTTTTPTTPTTVATTPEPTTPVTTIATTPAPITSEGLIPHSPITQIDSKSRACCTTPTTSMASSGVSPPPLHATFSSALGTSTSFPAPSSHPPFLLPLAIVMSTSFLIIALVLLVLVIRRRQHVDKQDGTSSSPVLAPAQTFSNASFSAESSMECSLNHIYVEQGERDSKVHDGLYTYVTKPSIIGGLPKGYAPSIQSPKRVFRGHPDGKCLSVQAKGFAADTFGDEDHYNLLFEDRPSVVNVIVMNAYENHQPNVCYRNYANVTEIPESTAVGFLEAPPTNSDDNISIKSSSVSTKSQDSVHKTVKPATGSDPSCSTHMLKSNDLEVQVEVSDDVVYENTPRSRGSSVKSIAGAEPKYYVLERQLDEDTDKNDDSGMVENILYQSVTE